MADTVRYFLERMVPELEELEEKGFFDKSEIKEIVKRRENFEYALKRRTSSKTDFIRCLEYEKKLLEVMELRKSARKIEEKNNLANAGCIRRCHELYERACRKFKSDLAFWSGWIEFCRETKSNKRMSKVLTSALQLHPKAAELWIYAAAWEFESNRNPSAARTLMQQGLRACKQDPAMWLEYFKMELVHAQKLVTRRKILGLESKGAEGQAEVDRMSESSEPSQKALQAVLSGAIAGIVAKEALKHVLTANFCQDLLQALEEHPFPGTEKIADEILQTMREQMGSQEDIWEVQARRQSNSNASTSGSTQKGTEHRSNAAEKIYMAAIDKLPTGKMFDCYLRFLEEQIESSGGSSYRLKGRSKKVAQRMLEILQQAAESGVLTEQSALKWPSLALRLKDVPGAVSASKQGTQLHPKSEELWIQYLQILTQTALAADAESKQKKIDEFKQCCKQALNTLNSASGEIWIQCLESVLRLDMQSEFLLEMFCDQQSLRPKGPLKGGMGLIAGSLLQKVWQAEGQDAARDFYQRLLKLSPTGGEFFHAVLDLEIEHESDSRLGLSQMTAIFEAAVSAYGREDASIWLRYAHFLELAGKGAGNITWRASKSLDNPEEFMLLKSKQHLI